MKTIIAIWNSAEKGKSSTILELANLLTSRYQNREVIFCDKEVNNLSIDFRLIIKINGKTIALESQGDPGTGLEKRLKEIVNKYNPDSIFCTCRTRGETVWAINNTANQFSYDKIWTSTYDSANNHKLINSLNGEHLLDLIIKLNLI